MTLILSAITRDYVVQVCDRRLTNATTGCVVDDDTTKTVMWNGNMLFSYTGLAMLPRPLRVHQQRQPGLSRSWPTNIWLAELLSLATDEQEATTILRDEAGRAVRSTGLSRDRQQHAFLGVGWPLSKGRPLRPAWVEVSNISSKGEFSIASGTLSDGDDAVVRSSRSQSDLPERLLPSVLAARNATETGSLLVEALREVAAVDATVGSDALFACLPRGQMERMSESGRFSISNRDPHPDHVTYKYLPADTDDGVARGLSVVLGGNVANQLIIGGSEDAAATVGLIPWPPLLGGTGAEGSSIVFNPIP